MTGSGVSGQPSSLAGTGSPNAVEEKELNLQIDVKEAELMAPFKHSDTVIPDATLLPPSRFCEPTNLCFHLHWFILKLTCKSKSSALRSE